MKLEQAGLEGSAFEREPQCRKTASHEANGGREVSIQAPPGEGRTAGAEVPVAPMAALAPAT